MIFWISLAISTVALALHWRRHKPVWTTESRIYAAWKVVGLAVLIWLTAGAVFDIWETLNHAGPWIIPHGEDGDILVVSEAEFKRRHYTDSGFGLFICGVFWWALIASVRRPKRL